MEFGCPSPQELGPESYYTGHSEMTSASLGVAASRIAAVHWVLHIRHDRIPSFQWVLGATADFNITPRVETHMLTLTGFLSPSPSGGGVFAPPLMPAWYAMRLQAVLNFCHSHNECSTSDTDSLGTASPRNALCTFLSMLNVSVWSMLENNRRSAFLHPSPATVKASESCNFSSVCTSIRIFMGSHIAPNHRQLYAKVVCNPLKSSPQL